MCKKTTSFKIHLAVKVDLVEEVYYLKLEFNLLYDESASPAEEFLYFSLV